MKSISTALARVAYPPTKSTGDRKISKSPQIDRWRDVTEQSTLAELRISPGIVDLVNLRGGRTVYVSSRKLAGVKLAESEVA